MNYEVLSYFYKTMTKTTIENFLVIKKSNKTIR